MRSPPRVLGLKAELLGLSWRWGKRAPSEPRLQMGEKQHRLEMEVNWGHEDVVIYLLAAFQYNHVLRIGFVCCDGHHS